jgi:predicted N-acyltransferase
VSGQDNVAHVRVVQRMSEVTPAAWDALAGDDDPFVEHAFLAWLEESGSVGGRTGWAPRHLLVEDGEGRLVAAAPGYLKDNSHGEYIFDWGWADAAWRAKIPYYPKLTHAVPFTPAGGARMLILPGAEADGLRRVLAEASWRAARECRAHGDHWLFCGEEEQATLAAAGWLARSSFQYHWFNHGYSSFEDSLESFVSRRRKEVRRERRQAAGAGLTLAVEPASALSEADHDRLWRCYQSTIAQHGAIPYLTERWWRGLGARLGHRAVVATARRGDEIVAMALAFHKGKQLFGRYWGALEQVPALHFELCYYQLIDYAIARGVQRVEAGAQGEHKLTRGFVPTLTRSAHRLAHAGLSDAVRAFVAQEHEHVLRSMAALSEHLPFRRGEE